MYHLLLEVLWYACASVAVAEHMLACIAFMHSSPVCSTAAHTPAHHSSCVCLLCMQVLQQWGAVRGLLQLRERLVGAGAPLSPGRFLYEAVGEVHLIKWTPSGEARALLHLLQLHAACCHKHGCHA